MSEENALRLTLSVLELVELWPSGMSTDSNVIHGDHNSSSH